MRRRELLAGVAGLVTATTVADPNIASFDDPADLLASRLNDLLLYGHLAQATSVPLPVLRASLAAAKADFQGCQYLTLADRLPTLITTAEACAADLDSDDATAASAVLAEAYNIATHACVKFGIPGLDWIAAERARRAADYGGHVLTQAETARMVAMLARRAGNYAAAERIALEAANRLDHSSLRRPEHLSLYGILLCNAGYTAAKAADRSRSAELLAEANAVANQLGGDRNEHWTAFGPTNVILFKISAAHALGDFGTAVDHAKTVPSDAIRLPERQSRYWVDIARAYAGWDKPVQSYKALTIAERVAPEEVRGRPVVRSLTRSLLTGPRQSAMPGLRAFARRVRVSV